MIEKEVATLATHLLASYGDRVFEVSMPDEARYDAMRAAFESLGRVTQVGCVEFFVIKVFQPLAG